MGAGTPPEPGRDAIMWIVPTVDGGGEAVFVIPPEVSDEQVGALAQTYDGELGGMPWVPCTGAH